jgi:hypothetical protein
MEEAEQLTLRFTHDGTFEFDYGEGEKRGRYLLGRYRLDSTATRLTLSVDYFLGQRRLPARYRRGNDFYLEYDLIELNANRLILRDRLTGDRRVFHGLKPEGIDPAERPLPRSAPTVWKLPTDWGG